MAVRFTNRKVTPSYVGTRPMGTTSHARTQDSTFQLMLGEVKKLIKPTDGASLSKLYNEYQVDVQFRQDNGAITTVTFPNCQIMNLFGGTADRFRYTLRPDETEPTGQEIMTAGSKVLLLCLSGAAADAYIVGGIREDDTQDEEGHNLEFEFNGINATIDKDGTLTLTHQGATGADGKVTNDGDQTNGTQIILDKNGDVVVQTGKNNDNVIHLDSQNKKIEVNATGGPIEVTASDNIKLKSSGVLTGSATDNTMMGTTYRNAQQQLHQQLMEQLTAMAVQLGIAAGAATGPLMTPTIGGMLAGPIIGPALIQCVQAVTQMTSAITSFEAQASTYLSKTNKSD